MQSKGGTSSLRLGLLCVLLLQMVSKVAADWGCSDVVDGNLFIAASVVRVDDNTFSGCSALTSVTFEEGSTLETIASGAFYNTGLTAISFPASLNSIAYSAFASCDFLTSVTYACSSTPLAVDVQAFDTTAYETNGRAVPDAACRVVNFPLSCYDVVDGNVLIPASLVNIADRAFQSCSALQTVTFAPDSLLETVGAYAFTRSGLRTITFPASLRSIAIYAFQFCSSLTSVGFSCSDHSLSIIDNAFAFCSLLSTVALPPNTNYPGSTATESMVCSPLGGSCASSASCSGPHQVCTADICTCGTGFEAEPTTFSTTQMIDFPAITDVPTCDSSKSNPTVQFKHAIFVKSSTISDIQFTGIGYNVNRNVNLNGHVVWRDRDYVLTGIPTQLAGETFEWYFQGDHKSTPVGAELHFTFIDAAVGDSVYVLLDSSCAGGLDSSSTGLPNIGFTRLTGQDMQWWLPSSSNGDFWTFKRTLQAPAETVCRAEPSAAPTAAPTYAPTYAPLTVEGNPCEFRIDLAVKFTSFEIHDYPTVVYLSQPGSQPAQEKSFDLHGKGPTYESDNSKGKVIFYVQTAAGIGPDGRGVEPINVGPLAVDTWYRIVAEKLARKIRLTIYDFNTGQVIESVTSAQLDLSFTDAQFCTRPFVPYCLACGTGSRTLLGEVQVFDDSVLTCVAGYAPTLTEGTRSCTKCPKGTFSQAGATVCTACEAGKYGPSMGRDACILCGAGKYGDAVGADSGRACIPCDGGTYSLAGAESCTNCAEGFFSTARSSECSRCPLGHHVTFDQGSCLPCPGGAFGALGATACTSCAAGTFSNGLAAVCTPCAAGQYSNIGYHVCRICPKGTFSLPGASACTKCAKGTFSQQGQSVCDGCAA